MVTCFKKHIAFVIFTLIICNSFAQDHLSSSVTFNKNNVYVGEPIQVTVSVFTSTWFTKRVNPGNIKVNGAFTVYFRSLSTSKQVKGKTFAGVQLFFNVFPYEDNTLEFPSLEIEVETPDLGGFKGIRHIVKTNSRTINVKSIPSNFSEDDWLVTTWMSATENWSGNLKNVKVGDVIERSISRNASNTVSELVPPIQWDSIANVSLYPTRSSVKNNKTKTAISASRTEGVRYLFEKEGEVVIPKIELTWYNPYIKKLYKKTMPEIVINVQPNPNLGMLATVKEQLEKTKTDEQIEEETAFNIFGLSLKQFSIILIISFCTIYLLIKIIRFLLRKHRRNRAEYLISEKYYFNQFLKSISTKSSQQITIKLYRWIDELPIENPTLESLSLFCKNSELENEIKSVNQPNKSKILDLKKVLWHRIRKQVLQNKSIKKTSSLRDWINP